MKTTGSTRPTSAPARVREGNAAKARQMLKDAGYDGTSVVILHPTDLQTIANMGSINPGVRVSGMPKYPGIGQDYARTFRAQKDMKIDIWLASHASQFKMHDKYKPGDAFNPDRFVDPAGFRAAVQQLEKTYLEQLARERLAK